MFQNVRVEVLAPFQQLSELIAYPRLWFRLSPGTDGNLFHRRLSFVTLLHTLEKLVAIVLTPGDSGEPSGGTLQKAESVSGRGGG